jgi:hypothetical protein
MSPPRALEGSQASEGPWRLNFIHFMVNLPLSRDFFIETNVFIEVHELIQLIRWHNSYNWLKRHFVYFQWYCIGKSQMSHSLERQFLDVFYQKMSEFLAFFAICISFKLVCSSCVWFIMSPLWQFLVIDIMYVIPPHNGFVHETCYRTVLMSEKVLEIWNSLNYVVCVPGTKNIYFLVRAKQDPKEKRETMEILDLQDSWALLDCLVHL